MVECDFGDALLVPLAFDAVTTHRYVAPFVRPVTVSFKLLPDAVRFAPPFVEEQRAL